MGKIPCEECDGNGYKPIPQSVACLKVCERCHGEGTNQCPHEDIVRYYKGVSKFVKCKDCGEEWEVID